MSDKLRITGMATGLDVDTMVKTMMKAENTKLDKLKQDKQILQWKQDLYREVLGDINTFKSTCFEILKPDSNMLSSNNYAGFDVQNGDSTIATATAGVGSKTGTYKISFIKPTAGDVDGQIAEPASASKTLSSTTLKNSKMSEITGITAGKITITYKNGTTPATVDIDITADSTITDVINSISSKTSGNVIASFSELTNTFKIETTGTGVNKTLNITDNTGIIGSTGGEITGKDAIVYITPPGSTTSVKVQKPTNNFTIDGIIYNFVSNTKNGTLAETTINVTSNVQKTFDKIKAFIDKYNENIEKIQSKIAEKKQYTYKPLTDEQKKEMEPEDIKAWETKVKQGLLKGDSNLQNMLYSMRSAFFQQVEGAGVSLKEIGLSTDSDYTKGGKIIIDEAKLKDAIQNKGEQVKNIFMKDYSEVPYDPDHKAPSGKNYDDRAKNIGIFQRINDILKDYTRTARDSNGKKGLLIEKAGIKGDLSEFENLISKEITKEYDKRINELADKLVSKENKYYEQFSKLESAMNKLNSQSNWLAQQLGGGAS